MIPDDWVSPGVATIVNRILSQIKPGSIILCHDGNADNTGQDRVQTVKALPIAIKEIRAAGYQFVTVSELLKLEPSSRNNKAEELYRQSKI